MLCRDEARSRRDCGERGLNVLGTRTRASASTAVGKSSSDSRRTCRSTVRTTGRGSPFAPPTPGSSTTASPLRRPAGTRTTSPTRSRFSDSTASARRRALPSRDSDASRALISSRRAAYRSTEPCVHAMPAASSSSAPSLRRT